MVLDPDLRELLGDDEEFPPLASLTLEEARAITRGVVEFQGEPMPVAEIRDIHAAGEDGPVRVRLYRPHEDPAPVLVWAHAGGWIRGDLDTWDIPLRDLANRAGVVVASVDYRLAPRTRFPGPLRDMLAALRHLSSHAGELGLVDRIAVGGDSAGGTLAAAAALVIRDLDAGPPLAAQVLVHPPMDPYYGSPGFVRYADGTPLSPDDLHERDDLGYLWGQYLPTRYAADHPYAAPARAADLTGLPPALVATAEHDVIRDDGERFAARLAEAGVPVWLRRFPGMTHSFMHFAGRVPAARALPEWLAATLRPLLGLS
jgi:acetyl esterase/lipase